MDSKVKELATHCMSPDTWSRPEPFTVKNAGGSTAKRKSLQTCHLKRPQREVCGHARVPAGAAGSGLLARVPRGLSRDSWGWGCVHVSIRVWAWRPPWKDMRRPGKPAQVRGPGTLPPPDALRVCTAPWSPGVTAWEARRGTRSSLGYCAPFCKSKITSKERARKRASLLWEKRTEMDQVKNKPVRSPAEGPVGGRRPWSQEHHIPTGTTRVLSRGQPARRSPAWPVDPSPPSLLSRPLSMSSACIPGP